MHCIKCESYFPARLEIDGTLRHLGNRDYCLQCKPINPPKAKITKEDRYKLICQKAIERGGQCLSKNYVNAETTLEFKCKNVMHPSWFAEAKHMLKGGWCQLCYFESLVIPLEDTKFIQVVKEKKGSVVGNFVNVQTDCEIVCALGHKWKARPQRIVDGTWCPLCSRGLSERICRTTVEQMFGEDFPSTRPSWLRNVEGNLMELDCYCEKLRLAFEYNGKQHYEAVDYFHDSFEKRQYLDEVKKKLCQDNNVNLIVIPVFNKLFTKDKLQSFIAVECQKLDIVLPVGATTMVLKYDTVHLSYEVEKQKKLEKLAADKNGEILSKYIGALDKIQCKCNNNGCGHIWWAYPGTIYKGGWCPVCGQEKAIQGLKNWMSCRTGEGTKEEKKIADYLEVIFTPTE